MADGLDEPTDLATLACDAATSIQNHISGKAIDYVSINRLISVLGRKIGEAGGLNSAYLFSKALEKYAKRIKCAKDDSGNIIDGDEILLRRSLFLQELRDAKHLSRQRSENLRDFCIEFCHWAMADSNYNLNFSYLPRFVA